MNSEDLLANAVEYLDENVEDNRALVPISLGLELEDNGKRRWACYLQVESKRWGEVETSARAKYPDIAIHNALAKLKRELTPRYA